MSAREAFGPMLGALYALGAVVLLVIAMSAVADGLLRDTTPPAGPATVTTTATATVRTTATATVTVQARAARAAERPSQLDDALDQLAACESSGRTDAVSPSGRYRGLFQFDQSTWRATWERAGRADLANLRPDQAPAPIQTQAARLLHADRGFQPWPQCSRKLGLS